MGFKVIMLSYLPGLTTVVKQGNNCGYILGGGEASDHKSLGTYEAMGRENSNTESVMLDKRRLYIPYS